MSSNSTTTIACFWRKKLSSAPSNVLINQPLAIPPVGIGCAVRVGHQSAATHLRVVLVFGTGISKSLTDARWVLPLTTSPLCNLAYILQLKVPLAGPVGFRIAPATMINGCPFMIPESMPGLSTIKLGVCNLSCNLISSCRLSLHAWYPARTRQTNPTTTKRVSGMSGHLDTLVDTRRPMRRASPIMTPTTPLMRATQCCQSAERYSTGSAYHMPKRTTHTPGVSNKLRFAKDFD